MKTANDVLRQLHHAQRPAICRNKLEQAQQYLSAGHPLQNIAGWLDIDPTALRKALVIR